MKLTKWLYVGIYGLGIVLVFAVVILRNWGEGQEAPVSLIQKRVQKGWTLPRVRAALAGTTTCFEIHDQLDGTRYAKVSKVGLGSIFVPQHAVTLYFDKDGKLFAGIAKYAATFGDSSEKLL